MPRIITDGQLLMILQLCLCSAENAFITRARLARNTMIRLFQQGNHSGHWTTQSIHRVIQSTCMLEFPILVSRNQTLLCCSRKQKSTIRSPISSDRSRNSPNVEISMSAIQNVDRNIEAYPQALRPLSPSYSPQICEELTCLRMLEQYSRSTI